MKSFVSAGDFIMAAARAGLFVKTEYSRLCSAEMLLNYDLLRIFERRDYAVRPVHPDDLPFLLLLEKACWAEPLQASPDEIMRRLELFPDGQYVLQMDEGVAGVIYSQRIEDTALLTNATAATVSALHREDGKIIQLIAVNVFPALQDRGLGDQLLEFMLQYSFLRTGVERVAAVSLCKNYVYNARIPMEQYIRERNEHGRLLDPILNFHERHGALVTGIVQGYRPKDLNNMGNGVLVEYDIRLRGKNPLPAEQGIHAREGEESKLSKARRREEIHSLIEKCVRSVMGEKDEKLFSPKMPLMEMGLDSLTLMELRSLLSRQLGEELDSSFFFRCSTPEAIARFFTGAESSHSQQKGNNKNQVPQKRNQQTSRVIPERRGACASGREAVEDVNSDPIAIIGMACRFPGGVKDSDAYWTLLRDGVDAISEIPGSRWDIDFYYDQNREEPGKIATRYGGFLEGVDLFDAQFFRISSREAAVMDPQQRLLLEVAWEALENAGLDPESLSGSETGVFTGIFSHDYEILQIRENEITDYETYFATGNSASVAAGRLSYFFGFQGPALSVDTACSSSLVAVHLACQSLRNKECEIALAAGVNLLLSPELSITFSRAGMLSPDGRCKTFDASADGYVRSEGCGVVVLKRLSQALADKDSVLAVIRGSAVNQDGSSNGLTAPNGLAQEAVIRRALLAARISPQEVSYVEAHGTGTSLGDPVEVKALGTVYRRDKTVKEPLVLGSVKANIGHTEAAAGIAGLMKVVLAMQNRCIPTQLHYKRVNPYIELDTIPAAIPAECAAWQGSGPYNRLIAGVSSFGFSGTNAHVIVEESPEPGKVEVREERPLHLLTLSAKTEGALR
ncbi:MAG: beta-ketoacyl synthase N-terminal-like domain-containing protein, partial [Dissulfurispiraceae bacterium]